MIHPDEARTNCSCQSSRCWIRGRFGRWSRFILREHRVCGIAQKSCHQQRQEQRHSCIHEQFTFIETGAVTRDSNVNYAQTFQYQWIRVVAAYFEHSESRVRGGLPFHAVRSADEGLAETAQGQAFRRSQKTVLL